MKPSSSAFSMLKILSKRSEVTEICLLWEVQLWASAEVRERFLSFLLLLHDYFSQTWQKTLCQGFFYCLLRCSGCNRGLLFETSPLWRLFYMRQPRSYSIARPFLSREIIFLETCFLFFFFFNALLRNSSQVTQDFEGCDWAFTPSARVKCRSNLPRQRLALPGRTGGTLCLSKPSCPLSSSQHTNTTDLRAAHASSSMPAGGQQDLTSMCSSTQS